MFFKIFFSRSLSLSLTLTQAPAALIKKARKPMRHHALHLDKVWWPSPRLPINTEERAADKKKKPDERREKRIENRGQIEDKKNREKKKGNARDREEGIRTEKQRWRGKSLIWGRWKGTEKQEHRGEEKNSNINLWVIRSVSSLLIRLLDGPRNLQKRRGSSELRFVLLQLQCQSRDSASQSSLKIES